MILMLLTDDTTIAKWEELTPYQQGLVSKNLIGYVSNHPFRETVYVPIPPKRSEDDLTMASIEGLPTIPKLRQAEFRWTGFKYQLMDIN